MSKSLSALIGTKPSSTHLGLFRTCLDDIGECARMHPDAGDAGPYLTRAVYKSLHFKPEYEDLPLEEEYQQGHPPALGWSASPDMSGLAA